MACRSAWVFLLVSFFFLPYSPVFGEEELRYALELHRIPMNSRSVAMGDLGVTLPYSGICAINNPSLASFSTKKSVWVEGARLYGGLSDIGVVSLAAPIQERLNLGVHYQGFFSGDIRQYDSLPGTYEQRQLNYELRPTENSSTGVFRNNQSTVRISVARLFSLPVPRPSGFSLPFILDIAGGLNFKYYWQTMNPGNRVYVGMNVNVDVGLAVRLGFDYDLKEKKLSRQILLSAAIHDVLPTRVNWLGSYLNYAEETQSEGRYGIAYIDESGTFFADWTAAVGMSLQYENPVQFGLEAEFWDIVAIRAGLNGKVPSVGAGVRIRSLSLDYAITFDAPAYTPLRLSLGYEF